MPLDDTYVGYLIEYIGRSSDMVNSDSICMGLGVKGKLLKDDWENVINVECIMAGMTLFHGLSPVDMERKFNEMLQPNFVNICHYNKDFIFNELENNWKPDVFKEWKLNYKNYVHSAQTINL